MTTELIAALEAAEGPNRELDRKIAAVVGHKHGPDSGWCNKENGDYWTVEESASQYTASIDAAMMLVPEGWSEIGILLDAVNENCSDAWLANLPRFICIAALRAKGET